MPVLPEPLVFDLHRPITLGRLVESRTQIRAEVWMDELKQVQRGCPTDGIEVAAGPC